MSWGTELWDKYSELTHHAQNGIDFLEYSVASFVKERGKVEAEYAKQLRALVKKYSPKGEQQVRKTAHFLISFGDIFLPGMIFFVVHGFEFPVTALLSSCAVLTYLGSNLRNPDQSPRSLLFV